MMECYSLSKSGNCYLELSAAMVARVDLRRTGSTNCSSSEELTRLVSSPQGFTDSHSWGQEIVFPSVV